MPNTPDAIRIEGLVDMQRALKALDGETQKQLRVALNTAATIVAKGAIRRAPLKSGALRASIRESSQQRSASVSEGSAKAPYAGFVDYGNVVHGGRGSVGKWDQVPRPFIAGGRILYPAFLAQRTNIIAVLNKALHDLARESGLEIT